MSARIRTPIATFLLLGAGSASALGQTVERATTITGPRGRSVERDVRIQRGPGSVDRQLTIRRPGGTYSRETFIQRPGAPLGFVGRGGFGGPPPGYFIQRNFIVPPPVPAVGIGLPFFNFFVGAPPAPPVVVMPPPLVAAPGGPVYAAPTQAAPPPGVGYDVGADALGRLKSLHANSRRDGALTLGRLRDPRGVPALIDRLEHDTDKHVRMAAAWSLAEIGDPRAAIPLQRIALYDKKQEVRDQAAQAYRRMPREDSVSVPAATPPASEAGAGAPALTPAVPSLSETPPPPPRPDPPSPGFSDRPNP